MISRFFSRPSDGQPAPANSRPLRLLFFFLLLGWLGGLAAAWLRLPVSYQELLANFAKARDFLSAAESVGGLPWWSPMFLQGTSLASSWSLMVSNAVMWAFSVPLGFLAGPKLALLFLIGVGAVGMFQFLKAFAGDDWTAGIGGALFLLSPSLLTHAAGFEHFPLVCSMAILPWTFLALHAFFRGPSLRTALLCALAFSAMSLANGKTGLMALPVLIIFSATEYFGRPAAARPGWRLQVWVLAAVALMCGVPNLPALREAGFMAGFEFAPFEGWQYAFSTKSALGWVDRGGLLTEGIAGSYAPTTGNGGTYLGLLACAVFALALFSEILHRSPDGKKARLFLVLALVAFWLSFGPKGVLGGHLLYLSLSQNTPDFSPALGWFFLAAQVWVIFRLVPPDWPARRVIAGILSGIYLIVPGFRLLSWLPLYRNIPTPFDFFQITGAVCVVVAAAILVRLLFAGLPAGSSRTAIVTAVSCLALLDASPYAKFFFQGAQEADVFSDFVAAQDYLRTSPIPGRVYPFSGRYFYLLTPDLSGRPLVAEAFNSALQQRGAAILQGAAFANDETLLSYLNISGISHVLIDKTDPDTPAEVQERLRGLLPVGFENERFVVLDNAGSLGAGFVAKDFILTPDNEPVVAVAALGGAHFSLATIYALGVPADEHGLRGRVTEGRIEAAKPGEAMQEGQAFVPVKPEGRGSYQSVGFPATGTAGWLVMNQAWHPDWRADQDGKSLKIHRAFLAFQAVKTDGKSAVTFRFEPPWWYPVCAILALLSWLLVLGGILFSGWWRESAGHAG